ncbi:caskin-2-like isoform X2 [Macrobrachium nipponense]|uniref:caskin-2-like isoform X2 n=1 Tax=Macrobrachium nipponense TaxID=159736 RepID=UPI0030C7C351
MLVYVLHWQRVSVGGGSVPVRTEGPFPLLYLEHRQLYTGPSDENQDHYIDGGECLTNIPEEGEEKAAGASGEEEPQRERTQEVKGAGRQGQGTHLYLWGTGWKSEADLPSSVADCFEDPSLLARLQARLLTLLGRASRYRLHRGLGVPPVMSLDTLRRKVKEARKRLLHHHPTVATSASQHSTSSSSSTSSSPLTRKDTSDSLATPDSPASRLSSPGVIHDALSRRNDSGISPPGNNSLQQYWGGGDRETSGGEEELELLQQYLNLQQLAVSRKHSTQLRRIRDSLVSRVRSRPSSMVKPSVAPRENPKAPVPNKERQALRNFLLDIGFVQYYSLLNRHGYDLATAAHMDALDLASVGITEPLHRMAIKFEFDLVKRPPPVPDDIPETCEEWLSSMGLEDYIENFHQNGIYCPLAALGLTKRDLQVMGIYMLGHRKKILLAILGLKESLLRRE